MGLFDSGSRRFFVVRREWYSELARLAVLPEHDDVGTQFSGVGLSAEVQDISNPHGITVLVEELGGEHASQVFIRWDQIISVADLHNQTARKRIGFTEE